LCLNAIVLFIGLIFEGDCKPAQTHGAASSKLSAAGSLGQGVHVAFVNERHEAIDLLIIIGR
jgi:hypothetical protein